MSLPLDENLTVETVIAELSSILNMSDEELYEKFPRLKGFDGYLRLERSTNEVTTHHESGGSVTTMEPNKALCIGAHSKEGEVLFAYFLQTDGSVRGAEYKDGFVLPMNDIS